MTTPAIHQFIDICGGHERIHKGAMWEEPAVGVQPIAYIVGRCAYVAHALQPETFHGQTVDPINPYLRDTLEAQQWAAGKLHERKAERQVVEAYERAKHAGRLS